MKKLLFLLLSINFIPQYILSMEGGRIDGSMAREGMGFHSYHGGYHNQGGYRFGRAYGSYMRHFAREGHPGYDRYGSIAYVRNNFSLGYGNPYYKGDHSPGSVLGLEDRYFPHVYNTYL